MLFLAATNVVASWPPERRLTGTPHARAKIMTFKVTTNVNVVASRPPERKPTGTPHARANFVFSVYKKNFLFTYIHITTLTLNFDSRFLRIINMVNFHQK